MSFLDRTALQTENGLPCFRLPEIAGLGWIKHAFLTRKGGSSPAPYDSLNVSFRNGDREEYVLQNRNLISHAFQFKSENLVLLNQMHEDRILLLRDTLPPLPPRLEYDAIITNIPGIVLGIRTADCIPIFVVDSKRRVVAAVHAGRQGTALHVTEKVLKRMAQEFGSASPDLLIGIGPSIRSCCYEIDGPVFQPEWKPFSVPKENGRWMVDLTRINLAQMEGLGIKEEQISRIDLCSSCHNDLFFSYRKEGRTGRQLSFIGMTTSKEVLP
jgi:YfiH family protein